MTQSFLLSHVQLFVTPWAATCQASLSFINSWSLLKFMSIESVMTFNHLVLCHPLLLPSIFPILRVFSNELALCIPCSLADKKSAFNVEDLSSIPGLGRSPREGKGYPLQYSSLENSMDSPWGHKESDTTE